MATQVQIRRGTTAQNAAFIGASGEISADTQAGRLHVHDGSTVGGVPQALKSEVTAAQLSANAAASTANDALVDAAAAQADATQALADAATAQATANAAQPALGFTPENVANKSDDDTMSADSSTLYPTQHAAKTYADTKQAALGFTPVNLAGDKMTGNLGVNNPGDVFEEFGGNIVDNTGWTLEADWSWIGSVLVGNGNSFASAATRSVPSVAGNRYRVYFRVQSFVGSSVEMYVGSGTVNITGNGDYAVEFISLGADLLEFYSFSTSIEIHGLNVVLLQAVTIPLHVNGDIRVVSGGDVWLGNAAAVETPVASHTLIVKDSAGVAYRLLCVPV